MKQEKHSKNCVKNQEQSKVKIWKNKFLFAVVSHPNREPYEWNSQNTILSAMIQSNLLCQQQYQDPLYDISSAQWLWLFSIWMIFSVSNKRLWNCTNRYFQVCNRIPQYLTTTTIPGRNWLTFNSRNKLVGFLKKKKIEQPPNHQHWVLIIIKPHV